MADIRDIDIKAALVIPDNIDGVETIFRLHPRENSDWHSFSVESVVDDEWNVHCAGKISAAHKNPTFEDHPVDESALTQRASGKRWYEAFRRLGFSYANTFQQLQDVRTDKNVHHASSNIMVTDKSGVVEGESRYIIHPSVVDTCLQLIIISIHAGRYKEMEWGVVPTKIEEVSIFFPEEAGWSIAWSCCGVDERFSWATIRYSKRQAAPRPEPSL